MVYTYLPAVYYYLNLAIDATNKFGEARVSAVPAVFPVPTQKRVLRPLLSRHFPILPYP